MTFMAVKVAQIKAFPYNPSQKTPESYDGALTSLASKIHLSVPLISSIVYHHLRNTSFRPIIFFVIQKSMATMVSTLM